MLTPDFTIKRSDVGKMISGQFLDANGEGIDCTGFTQAIFTVRNYASGEAIIDGETVTFITVDEGWFRYTFTSDDLAAMTPDPRGEAWFKAEFQVTLPLAQVITIPTDPVRPYLIIKLDDDLRD